jgi:DNA-directed RNA polymerase specialized sigma24 family protein
MKSEWGGLANPPANSDALTDTLRKMQRSVEKARYDSHNGYEEALAQVVDDLSTLAATDINNRSRLLRRFRSLGRNRSRRERSRRRQLQALLPYRVAPPDPATVAENRDLLEVARSRMPPEDWALFEARSRGDTFDEIAHRTGVSPEALRRRASRHRAMLQYLIA